MRRRWRSKRMRTWRNFMLKLISRYIKDLSIKGVDITRLTEIKVNKI